MSDTQELLKRISELTIEIKNKSPELIKYLDENPLTIPSDRDPHVEEQELQDYLNTLKTLYNKYNNN